MTNSCNLGSEIHVWFLSTTKFNQCDIQRFYDTVLSSQEKKRANRLLFEESKKKFVASRYFLRSVLGRYLGCNPRRVSLGLGKHKKPILLKQPSPEKIFFNLSHSGNKCALVVGKQEALGIDLEASEKARRFDSLSKRYFSANEYESIVKLESREKRERFYQLWTLKEAYAKASGNSLPVSLGKTSFSFDGECISFERERSHGLYSDECCFLILHEIAGFKVSIVIMSNDTKIFSDLRLKSFEFVSSDRYTALDLKSKRILK